MLSNERRVRELRKSFALKCFGGSCRFCGSTRKLEFDHIDPATKRWIISHSYSFSMKRFMSELVKCQLLCRECHIEKTNRDRGPRKINHGTNTEYGKHHCRCGPCSRARARYAAKRRPPVETVINITSKGSNKMSNSVNEALLLEAQDYINSGELSSTPMEGMLENDIKQGDLESLWAHIIQAREFLRPE